MPTNIRLGCKGYKETITLAYGRKKFYNIGPRLPEVKVEQQVLKLSSEVPEKTGHEKPVTKAEIPGLVEPERKKSKTSEENRGGASEKFVAGKGFSDSVASVRNDSKTSFERPSQVQEDTNGCPRDKKVDSTSAKSSGPKSEPASSLSREKASSHHGSVASSGKEMKSDLEHSKRNLYAKDKREERTAANSSRQQPGQIQNVLAPSGSTQEKTSSHKEADANSENEIKTVFEPPKQVSKDLHTGAKDKNEDWTAGPN